MGKSQELYKHAKLLIPGGTQLLSKRPEMFLPELWPAYYKDSKGCMVRDLDNKQYIDMSFMGIGACILGYADPDVNKAVKKVIDKGSMNTLNAPEEVKLAELLIELHPWADMIRYARCGGEAMAIAVRIARAAKKRDIVLFCGYHGWSDWYLSANLNDNSALDGQLLPGLNPLGVPRGLKGSAYPFNYNDTEGFIKLFDQFSDQVAAVVMEPIRNLEPQKEFIDTIRVRTKRKEIPLVIDEVSAGFRMNLGGAHLVLNIEPDIAVFAKGMSNGYPMAAIIGKKEYMSAAQDTFISSTYWTERIGPAAAIASIEKMRKVSAQEQMMKYGKLIQNAWASLSKKRNINIHVGSIYPLSHFDFISDKALTYKTLFTQFMLERGFLASTSCYLSYAHKTKHINAYIMAIDAVFNQLSIIFAENQPEKYLKGPVCHSGFKRLN